MVTEKGLEVLVFGEFERWYIKDDELVIKMGLNKQVCIADKFPIIILDFVRAEQTLMPSHKGYSQLANCCVFKVDIHGKVYDSLEPFTGKPGQYFVLTKDSRNKKLLEAFGYENVSA